ncbi:MAG: M56 family metallopeptidase [Planctomycetaceae bacterium]
MFETIIAHDITSRLGWTLLHFVWQGGIIGLFAAMFLRVVTSPQVRYRGGLMALALMLAVPMGTFLTLNLPTRSSDQRLTQLRKDETGSLPNDWEGERAGLPEAWKSASGEGSIEPGLSTGGERDRQDRLTEDASSENESFASVDAPSGPALADASPSMATPRPLPAGSDVGATATVANAEATSLSDSLMHESGSFWEPVLPGVVLVWSLGVLLFAARLFGGWCCLRGLMQRGTSPLPTEWMSRVDRLAMNLRVSRPVTFLVSQIVQVPATFGWWRPVVLVPASILTSLAPLEVEALLAHELAHIRRADWLVNLLQCIVETLLFYHPAVWWVSGQVRKHRECICDDLAVEAIGDRLVYTRALAALVEHAYVPRLVTAAGGQGDVVSRIRRLLGVTEPTRGGSLWLAPLLILLVASTVAFAMMGSGTDDSSNTPTPSTTSAAEEPKETLPVTNPIIPRDTTTGGINDQPSPTTKSVTIVGTVVTPEGKPVANAPVWLTRPSLGYRELPTDLDWTFSYLYGETKTDESGAFKFEVTNPALLKEFGPQATSGFLRELVPCDVVTVVEGYAVSWRHVSSARPFTPRTIVLREATTIEGTVVDTDGKPVVNERVSLAYAFRPEHLTTRNISDPHPLIDRDFLGLHHITFSGELYETLWNNDSPAQGLPWELGVMHRFLEATSATTDEDGHFKLKVAPKGLTCLLYTAAELGMQESTFKDGERHRVYTTASGYRRQTIAANPDVTAPTQILHKDASHAELTIQPNPVKIETYKLHNDSNISLRVVYDDTGKPAAGASLPQWERLVPAAETPVTDADGRMTIPRPNYSQVVLIPPKDATGYVQTTASTADGSLGWKDGVLEVRLKRGAVIQGMVVDEETREGVAGVPVVVRRVDPNGGHRWAIPVERGISQKDGTFELTVSPGEWQVMAGGPVNGWVFQDWKSPLTPSNAPSQETSFGMNVVATVDKPQEVVLVMQFGYHYSVTATLPDGSPAAGATVVTAFRTNGDFRRQALITVDDKGQFELPGLYSDGGGKANLSMKELTSSIPNLLNQDGTLHHEPCRVAIFDNTRNVGSLLTITPPFSKDPTVDINPQQHFHVPLKPMQSVTGRVIDVDSGEPIKGVILRLLLLGAYEGSLPSGLAPKVPVSHLVQTDADGRYQLDGVIEQAVHRVDVVFAYGYGTGTGPVTFKGDDKPKQLGDIQLEKGDNPRRTFGWQGQPALTDTSPVTLDDLLPPSEKVSINDKPGEATEINHEPRNDTPKADAPAVPDSPEAVPLPMKDGPVKEVDATGMKGGMEAEAGGGLDKVERRPRVVQGQVSGNAGPVEGGKVSLSLHFNRPEEERKFKDPFHWDSVVLKVLETTTDAEGKWKVEIPERIEVPGLMVNYPTHVEVRYEADGYLPRTLTPFPIGDLDGGEITTEEASWKSRQESRTTIRQTQLKRAATLRGIIITSDSKPAVGAKITVATMVDPYAWKFGNHYGYGYSATSIADEQGQFTMIYDPQSTASISYKGDAPLLIDSLPEYLSHQQNGDEVRFELPKGIQVKGRVLDAAGTPIVGAVIVANRAARQELLGGFAMSSRTCATDRDGYYKMPPLAPGDYSFHVSGQLDDPHQIEAFNRLRDDGRDRTEMGWGRYLLRWGDENGENKFPFATTSPASLFMFVTHTLGTLEESPTLNFQAMEMVNIRVKVDYPEGKRLETNRTFDLTVEGLFRKQRWSGASASRGEDGFATLQVPKGVENVAIGIGLALYQQSPDGETLGGEYIHIPKVDADIDGISVMYRPTAKLKVKLQGVKELFQATPKQPQHLGMSAYHVRRGTPFRQPIEAPFWLSSQFSEHNNSYRATAIAGEEIVFQIKRKNVDGEEIVIHEQRLTLNPQEERTLNINLAPPPL